MSSEREKQIKILENMIARGVDTTLTVDLSEVNALRSLLSHDSEMMKENEERLKEGQVWQEMFEHYVNKPCKPEDIKGWIENLRFEIELLRKENERVVKSNLDTIRENTLLRVKLNKETGWKEKFFELEQELTKEIKRLKGIVERVTN